VASEDERIPDHDRQDDVRRRQVQLLRELATRLEHGDPPLPTDVFAIVLRELELYRDDDAIDEAYREQGERKAEPWVFCRGRVQG
jgi:hypothetical protein